MSDSDVEIEVGIDPTQMVEDLKTGKVSISDLIAHAAKLESSLKQAFSVPDLKGMNKELAKTLALVNSIIKSTKASTPAALSKIARGYGKPGDKSVKLNEGVVQEAALERQIFNINNTVEQRFARLAKATLAAHKRSIEAQANVMTAMMEQQKLAVQTLLIQSTPGHMAAQLLQVQQQSAQLQARMRPENFAATQALDDFRLSKRQADADRDVLRAQWFKDNATRGNLLDQWGNPVIRETLQRQADQKLAHLQDEVLQDALLAKKETQVRRTKTEYLDKELQNIREQAHQQKITREKLRSNPDYVRGMDAQAKSRADYVSRVGQVGEAHAQRERILERVSANGGADMVAIQARIMGGYMALSGAINIARNLSTFVVQLDKEFKQFQAITNTTSGEMVNVKKRLIEVSEATKFTALEVAEAATILGQAGLSAQNVSDSIESITLLATAAGTNLKDSVEAVTSTLSIFNLEANQAGNIANTFTAALNGSKLSMDKITLGLQYAGNTAAQFGVTYQELTAMMGAMANSGIKSGSTLGTGMRMLLVSLTEPTKKFRAELAALGLSTADVDVKSKGLVGVLKTLKEAGFGASEAYKSFEVRAASAYAALSNNLTLGMKLEESFVGSTAAMKANETQMESLANQWNRWQSVIGTAAYTAFEPLIGIMAKAVGGAASLVSGLNQIPGVLKTVSIAFAGLGTFAALKTATALVRGIGLAALVGEIKAATGAMAMFNVVVKANPLIFWASAAAAAATALYAFMDRTSALQKQITATEALISRGRQNIDTLQQGVSSLDQTIDNLRARQDELEKDPLARKLKIAEVIAQFAELGLKVNSTTTSVKDLIEALQEIKNIKFTEQLAELGLLVARQELLATKLEQQRKEKTTPRTVAERQYSGAQASIGLLREFAPNLAAKSDEMQRQGLGSRFGDAGDSRPGLVNDWAIQTLSRQNLVPLAQSDLNALADLRKGKDPVDTTEYGQARTRIETAMEVARNILATTEGEIAAGAVDPELPKKVKKLQAFIASLTDLLDSTSDLTDNIAQQRQAKANADRANLEAKQKKLDLIETNSPYAKLVQERAFDLDKATRDAEVALNKENIPLADRKAATQVLEDYINNLAKGLEAAEAELVKQLTEAGADEDEIKAIISQSKLPLEQSKVNAQTLAGASAEAIEKTQKIVYDMQAKVYDRDSKKALDKLKSATVKADVSGLLKVAEKAENDAFSVKEAIYKDALEKGGTPEDLEALTSQFNLDREAHNETLQELAKTATDVALGIETKAINGRIASLDAAAEEIQKQIDDVTRQINEGGAGLDFSGMMGSLKGLYARLAEIAGLRFDAGQELAATTGNGSGLSWLAGRESQGAGGFYADNKIGFVGRMQFGEARLNDFRRITGKKFTQEDFRNNPDLQREVERWHVENLRAKANTEFKSYLGKSVNGVMMDEAAMVGAMHIGGPGGLWALLTSGQIRKDVNQTSTLDYARGMSGKSLDYDAFDANYSASTLKRDKDTEARLKAEADTRLVGQSKALEASISESAENVAATMSKARAKFSPEAYSTIKAGLDKQDGQELEKFDLEHQGEKTSPLARNDLIKSLARRRYDNIMEIFNKQIEAEDDAADDALTAAQQKVSALQSKGWDTTAAEQEVKTQENLKRATDLANLEGRVAILKREQTAAASQYGAESAAALLWGEKLAEIDKQRLDLAKNLNIEKSVQNPAVGNVGQMGMEKWQMQTGYFKTGENGKPVMIDVADQSVEAWSQLLGTLQGGFETFFTDVSSGFKSLGDSLRDFGASIAKMLQQMLAKALAVKTVMALGSKIPFIGDAMKYAMPGFGMAAVGNPSIPGRDSVPYLLEPGEAVLRRSAVSVVGEDNIKNLNNLGNRVQTPTMSWPEPASKDGAIVNVWVVSPDQQPPMSENDIIAVVNNNIANRGSIKKMIQSVNTGQL